MAFVPKGGPMIRLGCYLTRSSHLNIIISRLHSTSSTIATGSNPNNGSQKGTSTHLQLNQLDEKWIKRWQQMTGNRGLNPRKFNISPDAESFYALVMFPYPSGMLHLGHVRVYTISDVISRFKRLQGYNVIHPMGWDAFGLPAENAAIERGINPAVWTDHNIAKMKEQMNLVLADFDWERELATCKPDYYKWTQKIFLLLYEKGLAYKKEAEINWDPIDQTVLANEQVDSNGKSWRSGALVEKKKLNQWFISITKYAESLNKDLESLKEWPDKVKSMQKNWIGESQGVEINLLTNKSDYPYITIFTSRPETIFSIQYLALSINHPIVVEAAKSDENLQTFIQECKDCDKESKVGYLLNSIKASRPIDSSNNKLEQFDLPVYVAPYVLDTYGTGAVMGCPGHDQRDYDFWKIHNPNIQPAISMGPAKLTPGNFEIPYTSKDGVMCDSSTVAYGVESLRKYKGMKSKHAAKEITKVLEKLELGNKKLNYRIRDWLISRQRYWGAPIPMVYCDDCGTVPVPDSELPVKLPDVDGKSFERGNNLSKIDTFVNTKCPSCGGHATRDTDTMDTFMDSSWYFFRYLDPKNESKPFDKVEANENLPVDMYIGGIEHAILHLLYTRFISKFLGDIGLWNGNENNNNEPITKLVTQGMVQGLTFSDPDTGTFIKPEHIDNSDPKNPKIITSGKTALTSYEKMSKSKYNGVDPAETVKKYGADATRAHMLFQAPISDALNWNEDQILGVERWLRRVISLHESIVNYTNEDKLLNKTNVYNNIEINGIVHKELLLTESEVKLLNDTNTFIERITTSVNVDLSFNTIISDLMKYTNTITTALKDKHAYNKDLLLDSYKNLLVIMSPVTPCVAEEAWELLSGKLNIPWQSISYEKFPRIQRISSNDINYNVFINGKARLLFQYDKHLITQPDDVILQTIFQYDVVNKFASRDKIKKIIKKPGMISLVVSPIK